MMAAIPIAAQTQDTLRVVMSGFPLGIGSNVKDDFYKPYADQLRKFWPILKENPYAHLVSIGCVDANEYLTNNDAKNGGLSTKRSNYGKFTMVEYFGIDPTRISTETEEARDTGAYYRSCTIELRFYPHDEEIRDEYRKTDTVVVINTTHSFDSSGYDLFSLRFAIGAAYKKFGGIPTGTVGLAYKNKVMVSLAGGTTLWTRPYETERYDYRAFNWYISPQVTFFLSPRFGLTFGYAWSEKLDRSQDQYLEMVRGPIAGATFRPFKKWPGFELYGNYSPGFMHRVNETKAPWKHTFQVGANVTLKTFGFGGKVEKL